MFQSTSTNLEDHDNAPSFEDIGYGSQLREDWSPTAFFVLIFGGQVLHDLCFVSYLKSFSADLRIAQELQRTEAASGGPKLMKKKDKEGGERDKVPASAFPDHVTAGFQPLFINSMQNPLAAAGVARALTSAVMSD
ncbi:hypothetical protein HDU93_000151 [Gonapodya sp. JEL0774]|nr:hypothetical protein HDU93_000151 [Gonapodya sp. JEL0774]